MNIVIYGSQYGTAKRYAEELSNRLGFELKSYEEVADVNLYDTIIYVGALYAGGVLGMKKTFKGMKDSNGTCRSNRQDEYGHYKEGHEESTANRSI